MPSRLFGAVLALIAALLLATTIATSALWHGHPSVNGQPPIERKTVSVGMLGAKGCNTGGDGSCQPVELTGMFPTLGYVELAIVGTLLLMLLALSLTSFAKANARKPLGTVAIVLSVLTAASTVALVVVGPTFKGSNVDVPIGYGIFVLGGGLVLGILSGVLAPKEDPPPSLRPPRPKKEPKPPRAAKKSAPPPVDPFQPFADLPPPPTQAPPIDVLALLHAEEPKPPPARPIQSMPPSPGGMLPGPAGPLGAGSAPPMYGTGFPPEPRAHSASVVPPPRAKAPSLPPTIPTAPRVKPPSVSPPAFSMPKLPGMPPPATGTGSNGSLPGLPPLPGMPPMAEDKTDANATPLADSTDVSSSEKLADTPVPDEPPERESASDLAETTARPKMDPAELAELEAKVPKTTAPENLEPPKEEKPAPQGGPQPACPQCEAPMNWVEEHLRFYCKSCRMYF